MSVRYNRAQNFMIAAPGRPRDGFGGKNWLYPQNVRGAPMGEGQRATGHGL